MMRKLIALTITAVLALVSVLLVLVMGIFPAGAQASHSNGAGPEEDFVVGSVRGPVVTPAGTFDSEQHVNARAEGPDVPLLGAPAEGWFRTRIDALGFEIRGRVLCINNVGNSSVTHGVITESSLPQIIQVGFGTISRRVDNGEGNDDPPDESFGMVTGPPPSDGPDCPHLLFPTLPVEQGNFVVHDSTG
jgi:hypothetical protein